MPKQSQEAETLILRSLGDIMLTLPLFIRQKLISTIFMNRFFYSVLLYLLSPLLIVYLAFRAIKSPDYRGRWDERFGLTRLKSTDLLIHSVSMGETLAAIPLIHPAAHR